AALLTPGRAAAACGDYVHIADAPGQPDTPSMPRSCNGPGCSNHVPTPILPLTPPPSSSQSKDCTTRLAVEANRADVLSRTYLPDADGEPIRISRAIFHPPRA